MSHPWTSAKEQHQDGDADHHEHPLIGILVEKLDGKTYGAVLRGKIAVPLRLTTLRKCAEPEPGEAPGLEAGSSRWVFRSRNSYAFGTADATTIITFIIGNGSVTGFEANADGNKRTLKKVK
ncbi:MAG: hypothetical protein H0X67_09165 [Acidobacteria bacterium]|nr:hypothetical protein [Acidobacteriota bacterium]